MGNAMVQSKAQGSGKEHGVEEALGRDRAGGARGLGRMVEEVGEDVEEVGEDLDRALVGDAENEGGREAGCGLGSRGRGVAAVRTNLLDFRVWLSGRSKIYSKGILGRG